MSRQNQAQFEALYRAHVQQVYAYCMRRSSREEAKDMTSDVFLQAWRRFDDMPHDEGALFWLYGVARNEVRTSRRSMRRSTALWAKVNGQPRYPEPGPDAVVANNAEQADLVHALGTLGSNDQEILRLRAYEDLSIRQIAIVLDCSPETAKKRCSRAMTRLRTAVDRAGRRRSPTRSRAIPEGGDG